MNRQKASVRSRGSSSSTGSDPRKRFRNCCRKFIAFMCTQVGVGVLIAAYAVVGAWSFVSIESESPNPIPYVLEEIRHNFSVRIWLRTEYLNIFNQSLWRNDTNLILKEYQGNVSLAIKKNYDLRRSEDIWTFPAALMYSLSVFTMIGYGNLVPKTQWGKGATIIYATFGIPLYVLYFLNMGKVLAKTFKLLYTSVHECSRERLTGDIEDGEEDVQRKKVIVPSTACLWVIFFYILIGTIIFVYWEKWTYLDAVYFCVTSLCKIGMGDFVPGAKKDDREQQIKLGINFIYMLLGMGLVAMCYNLMREDVKVKMKELNEDLKLCLEDLRIRFGNCCSNNDEDEYLN